MKLNVATIALDAMPFLKLHLPIFEKLYIPWAWSIAHGASANTRDTSWCEPQEPRLSRDGTKEYLDSIKGHPNVTVVESELWDGKTAQINAALNAFTEDGILLQLDADEHYTVEQLETIVETFQKLKYIGELRMDCVYYVGPNIVVRNRATNHYGNNRDYEWCRAWRYSVGQKFVSHEPPHFPHGGMVLGNDKTREKGLIFHHYSWVSRENVLAKLKFYGYGDNNIEGWDRLQKQQKFPVMLKDFMPWCDAETQAIRI